MEADTLDRMEVALEGSMRLLQSVSMKDSGHVGAAATGRLQEAVKRRRAYKKLRNRGRLEKAHEVLEGLVAFAGAPLLAEEEQLVVKTASGGEKVVQGTSSSLRDALFLGEHVDLKQVQEGISNKLSEKKTSKPLQHTNVKPAKSGRNKKKWWRGLTDIDPITMDPLSSLKYPPFTLTVKEESGDKAAIVHHFDGKVLAHYIVSTGNFSNPNNRQELRREDCVRLDKYLAENGLVKANVTDAFDLKKLVKVQVQNSDQSEAARSRLNLLEREASVVMRSLFSFPSHSNGDDRASLSRARVASQRGGSNQRIRNAVLHQDGNLTVVDANEWEVSDEPLIESLAEFPQMAATSVASPATSLNPIWPRAPPVVAPSSKDFPSLSVAPKPTTFDSKKSEWSKLKDRSTGAVIKPTTQSFRPTRHLPVSESSHSQNRKFDAVALCPYTPATVQTVRKFGLSWIATLQRRLSEFARMGGSRVLTPRLQVMSEPKRRFVQFLCRTYYGMETQTMDVEPHCWVEVASSQETFDCDISIVEALTSFESLVNNRGFSPGSEQCPFGIGFWEVLCRSGSQPDNKLIHKVLETHVRPSQYNIIWISRDHALVQFVERRVARKVYSKLRGLTAVGHFTWKTLQWWPCGTHWAEYQLQMKVPKVPSRNENKNNRSAEENLAQPTSEWKLGKGKQETIKATSENKSKLNHWHVLQD